MSDQNNDVRAVIVAAVTCLAVVATGAVITIAGATPPGEVSYSARVQAAAPEPTPEPIPVARQSSPVCPQMDNPGGRLAWVPSENPGPTPTNGTVSIPSMGVDAPVVRVGIDAGYKMVVPKNARDVAWLDQGGIPGFTQNLVLAGHINYSRVAGSFSRLSQVQPGAEVVLRIDDKELKYRVVWNCSFPRNTERAEQVMGYTNVESVTLISCGGTFDRAAGTHTNRIVVRAERIYDA